MISTVAAPIEAAATAGFFASLCCDAKQATTLLSVIAAVAGLAYSIFENSMLGIIGFVLMGVSTLAFYLLDNKELENIEKKLATGAEENAEQTSVLNQQMQTQIEQLMQNRTQMEEQLVALQRDNADRQQTQTHLETAEAELKIQVQTLTQINTELQTNLASMKDSSKQIQDQVQNLLQQNLTLGTQMGAFDLSVSALVQRKQELSIEVASLRSGLDVDLTKLAAQLELAATSSKDLMTTLIQKANTIESQFNDELAKTQILEDQLEAHGKLIQDERKRLDTALDMLTKKEAGITKREETIHNQDAELKATHAELRAEVTKLQALFETITLEKLSVEANLKALNDVVAGKLDLINKYDAAIVKKQQELEKIKAAAKTIPG